MFGRMDPRYAPAECARLGKYLTDHGYLVTDGALGPGSAVPSSAKLQELIGSSQPMEWKVDFDSTTQALGRLTLAQNDFGFVGSGTMQTDGISLWLSGRVSDRGSLRDEYTQLSCQKIANVESDGRLVRFGYNVDEVETDSMCLWLADNSAAEKLVAILPKRENEEFPTSGQSRRRVWDEARRAITEFSNYGRASRDQHVGIYRHADCRGRMAYTGR